MANEGSARSKISWTSGTRKVVREFNYSFDVAGTDTATFTQAIGFAAAEKIVLPADVASYGQCLIINHDATNFVSLGNWNAGSQVYTIKLLAGESTLFRPVVGITDLAALADTASVDLEIVVLEV